MATTTNRTATGRIDVHLYDGRTFIFIDKTAMEMVHELRAAGVTHKDLKATVHHIPKTTAQLLDEITGAGAGA